jgi:hypothetical protein
MTKTCSRCKLDQPTSEFKRDANSKDGFWGHCNSCRRELDAARRKRNQERNKGGAPADAGKTKTCSDCKSELSVTQFYRESARPDGFGTICKGCRNNRTKANRERHRQEWVPQTEGEKKCSRCGSTKAVSEFTVLRTRVDGLRGICRTCEAAAYASVRDEVFQYYGGDQPKCAGCGIDDQRLLTIDHVESNGATHRRELNGLPIYKALKRDGFPPGYQLLCWNCNALKYYRSDEDDAILYRQRRAEPWMNRGG